jgi:molybdate transport system substrate-binding protein
MTTRFSTCILVALCALTCASCKQSEPRPAPTAAAQPAAKTEQGQLVVYAAASLRDAFTQLGDDFKETHPGLEVTFNFAGSQELRTQIEHGAGADVFASADERQMSELRKAERVGAPVIFARNELVIVVANEQAATIKSIEDLPNAGKLVIGVADVPIGRYTLQLLDNASRTLGADFRKRVETRVVSQELNVKQVLAKVSLGEADVAIVYRTDITAAVSGKISVVPIAPELNVTAQYPIATVAAAPHAELGSAFMKLVLSAEGQGALARAGFLAPAPAAPAAAQ